MQYSAYRLVTCEDLNTVQCTKAGTEGSKSYQFLRHFQIGPSDLDTQKELGLDERNVSTMNMYIIQTREGHQPKHRL
jgi:hypothetical protein